jgi:hypothetical protein
VFTDIVHVSIMLHTPLPFIPSISPSLYLPPSPRPRRKRVVFEQQGRSSTWISKLTIAAQMADKHEIEPTAMKPPKEFRETVKIGSASSWDKNILSLFHVGFDRNTFADLENVIDSKYFRPPSTDESCEGK